MSDSLDEYRKKRVLNYETNPNDLTNIMKIFDQWPVDKKEEFWEIANQHRADREEILLKELEKYKKNNPEK